jgi:phosphodiesterase/alkaline phosphatase D-like protein
MFVTYTPQDPADGEPREWTFTAGRVRASEAQLLEREFGENWDNFTMGVQSGSMKARRVLLWHLLRRDHPMLRFDDVPDFFADELTVEMEVAELAPMIDRISKANLPAEKREQIVAALDLAMSDAMAREDERVALAGKASSTTPTDGG